MLRGSLITVIFEKATKLSLGELDSAQSVTLMSTDVERTIRGLLEMHDMWANVIQVAVATWLIETELGVACVAPIAIALCTSSEINFFGIMLTFNQFPSVLRWDLRALRRSFRWLGFP